MASHYQEIPSPVPIPDGLLITESTKSFHPQFAGSLTARMAGQNIRASFDTHENGMPFYLVGSANRAYLVEWVSGENIAQALFDIGNVGGALTVSPDRAGANTDELTILCPFADLRGHKRTRKRIPESMGTAITKAEGITVQVIADTMGGVAHAKNVVFVDMHNPFETSPWFARAGIKVLNLSLNTPLATYLVKSNLITDPSKVAVASTDVGNLLNAVNLSQVLGKVLGFDSAVPLAINDKVRIDEKNVIQKLILQNSAGESLADVVGKTVVCADDQISGGTTAVETITHLLEQGAERVVYFATAAVFSGNYYDKLEKILENPKVTIIVSDVLPFVRNNIDYPLPYSRVNGGLNEVRVMHVGDWFAEQCEIIINARTFDEAREILEPISILPQNPYEIFANLTGFQKPIPPDSHLYLGRGRITPLMNNQIIFDS